MYIVMVLMSVLLHYTFLGDELADVVNCRTGKTLENFSVGAFWKGFESMQGTLPVLLAI